MHRPWHIESMSNVCEDEPLSRHPWCLSETFPLWLTSWSLVCIRMKPSLCSVCPLGQWLKNLSGLKWQWEHMGLISQQKQIASVVTESPHNSNSTKKIPSHKAQHGHKSWTVWGLNACGGYQKAQKGVFIRVPQSSECVLSIPWPWNDLLVSRGISWLRSWTVLIRSLTTPSSTDEM